MTKKGQGRAAPKDTENPLLRNALALPSLGSCTVPRGSAEGSGERGGADPTSLPLPSEIEAELALVWGLPWGWDLIQREIGRFTLEIQIPSPPGCPRGCQGSETSPRLPLVSITPAIWGEPTMGQARSRRTHVYFC